MGTIGHFRHIKIQLGSEPERTQTKEMSKYAIQSPLFVSTKPYCQSEFQYIKKSIGQLDSLEDMHSSRDSRESPDKQYVKQLMSVTVFSTLLW